MSPSEVSAIIPGPAATEAESATPSDRREEVEVMAPLSEGMADTEEQVETMAPVQEGRTGEVEQVETMAPRQEESGVAPFPEGRTVVEGGTVNIAPMDSQASPERGVTAPPAADVETFDAPPDASAVASELSPTSAGTPSRNYTPGASARPSGWASVVQRLFRALLGLFGRG